MIFIENEIKKSGEGCGGQIELARNTLKNDFKIRYPKSINEQKKIAMKHDTYRAKVRDIEEIYQRKLTALEELKKSLLQKAFNGELT